MMRFSRYLRVAGVAVASIIICWIIVVAMNGSKVSVRISSLATVDNRTTENTATISVVHKDTRQQRVGRTAVVDTKSNSWSTWLEQRVKQTFDDSEDAYTEVDIQQMKIVLSDSAGNVIRAAAALASPDNDEEDDDTFEERRRYRLVKVTFLRFNQGYVSNRQNGVKQVPGTTAKPTFEPPVRLPWEPLKDNQAPVGNLQSTPTNTSSLATSEAASAAGSAAASESPETARKTVDGGRLYVSVTDKEHLGESMFQYAALYALSKATNRSAHCNEQLGGIYDIFSSLTLTSFTPTEPFTSAVVKEMAPGRYDASVERKLVSDDINVTLCCRLLSFKYFLPYESELRKEFVFSSRLTTMAANAKESFMQRLIAGNRLRLGTPLTPSSYTLVSVLLDFDLQFNVGDEGGAGVPLNAPEVALKLISYVRKAIRMYRKRYTNVAFFVAGTRDVCFHLADIIPNTRQDILYLPCTNLEEVFATMSLCCNHSIVTAGFLSWWSGWLTGGHVAAFGGWPANWAAGGVTNNFEPRDIYPPSWTVIY